MLENPDILMDFWGNFTLCLAKWLSKEDIKLRISSVAVCSSIIHEAQINNTSTKVNIG